VTEPQKPADAKPLNEQLETLDKQAQKAHEETERLIEKRDRLNEQFKQLREETRALKAERDSVNERVHALKAQRDKARTTVQPIIDEMKAAREKIVELKKKTPKRSQRDLQKEFDDIEWKIQTTSLDLQEEKRLIENVKQLKIQLNAYKKIDQQTKRIHELQQGLKAMDENGDKLHTELSTLAQQSQELHQKMLAKIEEAKKIKQEADTAHNASLLSREKARQLEEEMRSLEYEDRRIRAAEYQQRKDQRLIRETQRQAEEARRQQDEATRKTAEKELKEKLGSQAREKLQRGEKLSWDEFQLLADEDETKTQD
jgi:uncharacterized coiled-coil DUF342 family protein